MVSELAELVDRHAAALGGVWGTLVQSKQRSAADCRPDGYHRDTLGWLQS